MKHRTLSMIVMLGIWVAGLALFCFPYLKEHLDAWKILREMGAVLLLSATLGLGYELLIRKGFIDDLEGLFDKQLGKPPFNYWAIRDAGIINVHKRYDVKKIEEGFEKAVKRIRVLQTHTTLTTGVHRILRGKAESGCDVKVLILSLAAH